MRKTDLKSVDWKEGDYYISQCLEVEVSSFGKTRKEALDNLQDALHLYFEDIPFTKRLSELNASRLEIAAGKGKILKNLKDLR